MNNRNSIVSDENIAERLIMNNVSATTISPEDRKARINLLLRQVDGEIKSGNFEHALTLTHQVYSFDRKNLYARAFEERIVELRSKGEKEKQQAVVQPSPIEHVDFEKQQRQSQNFTLVENSGTYLHIVEQTHTSNHTPITGQIENTQNQSFDTPTFESSNYISELSGDTEEQLRQTFLSALESKQLQIERTFQRQVQVGQAKGNGFTEQGNTISSSSLNVQTNTIMVPLKMKAQQENEIKDWQLTERKRILEELTLQIQEEQRKFQEGLAEHYKNTYGKKLEEETGKAHQQALTAYRSTLTTLLQYKLPKLVQQAITRTMRTPLLITDEEHEQLEHLAFIDIYTNAILDILTKDSISASDWDVLAKQRSMYGISETEHKQLLKQVRRDLNLPDDTAVVFVIDDDPVVLTYTSHILKQIYPNTYTADSAPAAAKLFAEQTPNVIICDVNLPGMGGFAFYETILNGAYGDSVKSTPFIFASSLGDQFIINGAKQLGAKAYLVKPVSKELLENTVKECLV